MIREKPNQKLLNAVGTGDFLATKEALAAGADANAQSPNYGHLTPLHIAAAAGHTDVARLLLEKGADLDATDSAKGTPLHMAAARGQTETVRLLIEKGADINARNVVHNTPLHLAAQDGFGPIVALLIEKGANLHPRTLNQRQTPQDIAAKNGHTKVVALLTKADQTRQTATGIHRIARNQWVVTVPPEPDSERGR